MHDFTKRIRRCVTVGRLTTADLQHWFRRPYATLRTWVVDGRVPHGAYAEDANKDLALLERMIRHGKHFPIPMMSHYARPNHIRSLRANAIRTRVSGVGASA